MFHFDAFSLSFDCGDEVDGLGEVFDNLVHAAELRENYGKAHRPLLPGVIPGPQYRLGSNVLQMGTDVLD